jgi:hypothetical protein
MENPKQLPPKWVKFFSWCFAYLTIIPLLVTGQLILRGDILGLSAYGFSIEEGSGQLHLTIMLAAAILLGGLTGIFILTSRKYAYNFGIAYSLAALGVMSYGYFSGMSAFEDGGVQGLLLVCFLVHLIRNRSDWATSVANKASHPIPRRAVVSA